LFVFIGFIIHLVLDEMYSVDIKGATIKRSFGSAFKLIDYHSLRASALMATALVAAVALAPGSRDFEDLVRTPTLFAFLKERLLPKGKWFDSHSADTTAAIGNGEEAGQRTP
jgi:hypothetical protein